MSGPEALNRMVEHVQACRGGCLQGDGWPQCAEGKRLWHAAWWAVKADARTPAIDDMQRIRDATDVLRGKPACACCMMRPAFEGWDRCQPCYNSTASRVKAEREACARLAAEIADRWSGAEVSDAEETAAMGGRVIAKAIRKRATFADNGEQDG